MMVTVPNVVTSFKGVKGATVVLFCLGGLVFSYEQLGGPIV